MCRPPSFLAVIVSTPNLKCIVCDLSSAMDLKRIPMLELCLDLAFRPSESAKVWLQTTSSVVQYCIDKSPCQVFIRRFSRIASFICFAAATRVSWNGRLIRCFRTGWRGLLGRLCSLDGRLRRCRWNWAFPSIFWWIHEKLRRGSDIHSLSRGDSRILLGIIGPFLSDEVHYRAVRTLKIPYFFSNIILRNYVSFKIVNLKLW